jgi:hypothetical protein
VVTPLFLTRASAALTYVNANAGVALICINDAMAPSPR